MELALCAPVAALFAIGGAAAVQIADADSGLEAATQAAAAAAGRAPDAADSETAGHLRFADMIAAYPLRDAVVTLDAADFSRGGNVVASATASVDVGWAGLVFTERTIALHATARAQIEPWRSRR